jgi:flavin-dependent dehydrogenase
VIGMTGKEFDVIVVGGGPGGALAAKKCADSGFKTLLLEKKKLPREKVCSGMIMGPWANATIAHEFGDIPKNILTDPYCLTGHMIHVPGTTSKKIDFPTPVGWRRDLDFWMIQKVSHCGVEIRDGARVLGVEQLDGKCLLKVKAGGRQAKLTSGYVIAADGGASAVRKSIFPNLKVKYSAPIRECYKGSVEIQRDYIHWFFPEARPRPRFDLLHKGDCFLIEGSGIRVLRHEIREILATLGYPPEKKPEWRDGCLMPLLHSELISGAFEPAKGNILLAGDAAGLVFPVTFEGIGSAMKSGVLAAESIAEATLDGKKAAASYMEKLTPMRKLIETFLNLQNGLQASADEGAGPLSDALKHAYEETLRIG